MDTYTEKSECKNVMVNPLLKNRMEIQLDDRTIELSLANMSKYFYKLYVLTPFKNEPVDKDKMHAYAIQNFGKNTIASTFSELYHSSLKKYT